MLDVRGDNRQLKGLEIAATAKILRKGKAWSVPKPKRQTPLHRLAGPARSLIAVAPITRTAASSASTSSRSNTSSSVNAILMALQRSLRRLPCARQSERPTRKIGAPTTRRRSTRRQRFLDLLRDLCGGIAEPERQKNGRPPLPIQRCAIRRLLQDLQHGFRSPLHDRSSGRAGQGLSSPRSRTTIRSSTIWKTRRLLPILRALITESSRPLNAIEIDFAADSSGFTTSRFHRWYDHKYGVERQEHDWVKVHLMCGVSTHIVTAVEIHDRDASDIKLFPALVDATAENFQMREVSADKGYGSKKNLRSRRTSRRGSLHRVQGQHDRRERAVCGPRCSTISNTAAKIF